MLHLGLFFMLFFTIKTFSFKDNTTFRVKIADEYLRYSGKVKSKRAKKKYSTSTKSIAG